MGRSPHRKHKTSISVSFGLHLQNLIIVPQKHKNVQYVDNYTLYHGAPVNKKKSYNRPLTP